MIIEDDYDAKFRYDRDSIGALQGLAPDGVVCLDSVSKSLAPVLRLGWIISPVGLTDALARARRITDRGSPGLDQVALAIHEGIATLGAILRPMTGTRPS